MHRSLQTLVITEARSQGGMVSIEILVQSVQGPHVCILNARFHFEEYLLKGCKPEMLDFHLANSCSPRGHFYYCGDSQVSGAPASGSEMGLGICAFPGASSEQPGQGTNNQNSWNPFPPNQNLFPQGSWL